jgi:hypothetical protein
MADTKLEDASQYTDAQRWQREISAAEKSLERWRTASPQIVRRFLAQGGSGANESEEFPIFWSNVNLLQAAMYARMPKADVSRRFKDAQDDVGRVAGEMIERILNADMQAEHGDIDSALRHVIHDRLVVGLGAVWLRYEPTIIDMALGDEAAAPPDMPLGAPESAPDVSQPAAEGAAGSPAPAYGLGQQEGPMPGPLPGTTMSKRPQAQGQALPDEQVVDERVVTDYVHWSDMLWSPARTWDEVRWVARRQWLTRDELTERWGERGRLVPLTSKSGAGKDSEAQGVMKHDPWAKAGVWEIWCKSSRSVHFYVKGCDFLLESAADPLKLPSFWPCPRPMIANVSTSGLIPRADHTILRRVYEEMETVSERINLLEDAIRVVGVYDKSNDELKSVLNNRAMNQMIPVDQWAMFAEKGGLKGAVDWFPIETVVGALQQLRQVKADCKQEMYELTGLSDIMRGATDAAETATAQQLKAQFASVRLQYMQSEFARFVQDLLTIKAEIMAGHFQEEILIQKSMIDKSFDAALAPQAVALLRDKRLAYYSLSVAPDSMAMVDYMAEQKAAQEFMVAFAGFLQQAAPLAQQQPKTLPFLLQMLGAVVARFRFGKQVEVILDQAVTQALSQPEQPDPMQERMKQAGVAKTESEAAKNMAQAKKASMEAQRQPAAASKDLAQASAARKKPSAVEELGNALGVQGPETMQ